MNSANRRGFLKIAGAGAAAAGAASLVPASQSAALAGAGARTGPVSAAPLPAAASGSMVAYVDDVSRGELAVMIEGREVVVTDHDLVARLATAVHAADTASL